MAGAAAIALLAACSSSGSSSTSSSGATSSAPASSASASPSVTVVAGGSCSNSSATKVLFWAWVPGMGRAVTEFNKTHPNICVTQEDVGAGDPEYVAITIISSARWSLLNV